MFESQRYCRHKDAQNYHILEESVAADDITELANRIIRAENEKRTAFAFSDLFPGLRSKADLDYLIAIVVK